MLQFVPTPAAGLGRLKSRLGCWAWILQANGLKVAVMNRDLCRGVAKLVKASDFDSDMRGFESFLPCQIFC
jgi:hypothetical protein